MSQRDNLIDGWRGLSIGAVIVHHFVGFRFNHRFLSRPLWEGLDSASPISVIWSNFVTLLVWIGPAGVHVFFVISGYLITRLLIEEEARSGRVDIRAFYIRRCCRILPAFCAMLAAVWALKSAKLINVPSDAFLYSATFTCNIYIERCSFWLAHTWSLAVEEQFYLAWPLAFLLPSATRQILLLAVLALATAAAMATGTIYNFSFIACGALVASQSRLHAEVQRLASPAAMYLAASLIVLVALTWSRPSVQWAYAVAAPFLIAFLFFGSLTGNGPLARLIAWRPIQLVGIVSYSLYLWQQLSLAPIEWNGVITRATSLYAMHPWITWAFPLITVASYFVIERPFISLGRRLSEAVQRARRPYRAPIDAAYAVEPQRLSG